MAKLPPASGKPEEVRPDAQNPTEVGLFGQGSCACRSKKGSAPLPGLSPPSTWRDYSARARIYRGLLVGLGPRNPRCVSVESVESCVLAESAQMP